MKHETWKIDFLKKFSQKSKKQGTFSSTTIIKKNIEEYLKLFATEFLTMEPIKGAARAFKAAIFIFPDISLDQTTECIDGVQEICKPFYVRQGLMLGEFHLRNNSTGLRNQHFYPLRTPVRFFFFLSFIHNNGCTSF